MLSVIDGFAELCMFSFASRSWSWCLLPFNLCLMLLVVRW